MKRSRLIETSWLSYREAVIPKDAGAIQLLESRRAFYAGAQAYYGLMMRLLDPDAEPTDKDLEMVGAIERELLEFADRVSAGQA